MPSRKPAQRKPNRPVEALEPGDHYETSMTVGIKVGGVDYWLKEGVTVQVRENETTDEAKARAQQFVADSINQQIGEIRGA